MSNDNPSAAGQFKPGQSGNPGGRPRVVTELKQLHDEHGVEAFKRLVEIMREGGDKIAFQAAKEILDRIMGRTVQAVSGPDGTGVKVDIDALALLRRLMGDPPPDKPTP